MDWYLKALKQYAAFTGRARRREYWFFALFNAIALMVLAFIDGMMGSFSEEVGFGLLSGLYFLATLLPALAVTVRRLHDTDRSGWWILIGVIPVIGFIVVLVFTLLEGTPGENRYGPNPKAMSVMD